MKNAVAFGDKTNENVIWLEEALKGAGIILDWEPKVDSIPEVSLLCLTTQKMTHWPMALENALDNKKVVIPCVFPGGRIPVSLSDLYGVDFTDHKEKALKLLTGALQKYLA